MTNPFAQPAPSFDNPESAEPLPWLNNDNDAEYGMFHIPEGIYFLEITNCEYVASKSSGGMMYKLQLTVLQGADPDGIGKKLFCYIPLESEKPGGQKYARKCLRGIGSTARSLPEFRQEAPTLINRVIRAFVQDEIKEITSRFGEDTREISSRIGEFDTYSPDFKKQVEEAGLPCTADDADIPF